MGASNPADPMGSFPADTIGTIMRDRSSAVYPNSASMRRRSGTERPTCLPEERRSRSRRFLSSQSLYGNALASASLISASRTILPAAVSMTSIFPGLRRPVSTTSSGETGMTPASDAITTVPSRDTV